MHYLKCKAIGNCKFSAAAPCTILSSPSRSICTLTNAYNSRRGSPPTPCRAFTIHLTCSLSPRSLNPIGKNNSDASSWKQWRAASPSSAPAPVKSQTSSAMQASSFPKATSPLSSTRSILSFKTPCVANNSAQQDAPALSQCFHNNASLTTPSPSISDYCRANLCGVLCRSSPFIYIPVAAGRLCERRSLSHVARERSSQRISFAPNLPNSEFCYNAPRARRTTPRSTQRPTTPHERRLPLRRNCALHLPPLARTPPRRARLTAPRLFHRTRSLDAITRHNHSHHAPPRAQTSRAHPLGTNRPSV